MGKTKTAVLTGESKNLSGEEKYKLKQQKKVEMETQKKAAVTGVGLKGGERIKVIGGEIEETSEKEDKKIKTHTRGKKYKSVLSKIDKTKTYPLSEAIKLVKETSYSKFDGTMEIHLIVKKVGTSANVDLPHSFGKSKKVELADEKTIENLKSGKIDFDVLLATADMMPKLVPFAKILGPKGLMPNPKNGTLIKNVKDKDKFNASSLTLKTEKEAPLIHSVFGKISQEDKKLKENLEKILDSVGRKVVEKAYIKATMSPSVKVEV